MARAFAIALMAIFVLSAMDALIKAQAAAFGSLQIAFLRFAFGSMAVLASIAVIRPPRPHMETVLANGWRALLAAATAVMFFYALGHLPLAETLALSLLSPGVTALLGALILREHIGRALMTALLLGLAGVLVIIAPKLSGPTLSWTALLGAAAALASTLTYSLSLVLLRSRATRDHPLTIVAVQNIGSAALLALCVFMAPAGNWLAPTAIDLAIFGVLGSLGTVGHLLLTKAYGLAPAARMAPADYSALVFAAAFGLAFFGEVPSWTTIAGALLIVAGSLAAARR